MTQDEINNEYKQAAGALGEKLYHFSVPILEAFQIAMRMMQLNQEAWKLKQAEKKTAAEKSPVVDSAPCSVEPIK